MTDQDAADLALGRAVRSLLASETLAKHPRACQPYHAKVALGRYDRDVDNKADVVTYHCHVGDMESPAVATLDEAVAAAAKAAGL